MNASYFRNQVVIVGAVPAAMLLWDAYQGQLGANAVNNALHITGILSLLFLFFSLLVTPLRVVTGWNWLTVSRRSLGLYGFAYAMLHLGIYVVWDRMGNVSSTVDEIISRRFLTIGFIAVVLMIPLAITSTNAMIRRLGPTRWKRLHRLAYLAVILGVLHYYMLVKSDVRQPIAFALVLTPLLGFRAVRHYVDLRKAASVKDSSFPTTAPISSRPAESRFFKGELIVANIHQETSDVKTFRFINPGGGEIPFRHLPGQYMTLQLEIDGNRVRRSYTIASAPSQRRYVELTIKRNPSGAVSRFMHDQVRVGQRIQLGAPGGKFWFDGSTHNRVLLIAGGVGITPLMSILRYLTDVGWEGEVLFLNAARTAQDVVFERELSYLASRHSQLNVVNFLSQGPLNEVESGTKRSDPISSGTINCRYGYINEAAISELIPDLIDVPIYLCGPEPMMVAIRSALVRLGANESQIHTEEFISPQGGTANSETGEASDDSFTEGAVVSQVHFRKADVTVQCMPDQTLLELAELNHIPIESDCRSGICGQCKVRCLSGTVAMETSEALSTSEKRQGWILACQARATSESIELEA